MNRIASLAFALFALVPAAAAQTQVSWDTFAQVRLVRDGARFVPRFESTVQSLDGQRVKVQGFMLPLDQTGAQAHFVLSASPVAGCFFCMPGGPEAMIEIRAGSAAEFSYDPITITGKLELLTDDPMGMYYRLTEAVVQQ